MSRFSNLIANLGKNAGIQGRKISSSIFGSGDNTGAQGDVVGQGMSASEYKAYLDGKKIEDVEDMVALNVEKANRVTKEMEDKLEETRADLDFVKMELDSKSVSESSGEIANLIDAPPREFNVMGTKALYKVVALRAYYKQDS